MDACGPHRAAQGYHPHRSPEGARAHPSAPGPRHSGQGLAEIGAAVMTTHTAVKTSAWIERAQALAPVVAQWRDAGEQERHVPRPLFEALRNAGIFRMSVPTAVGGA